MITTDGSWVEDDGSVSWVESEEWDDD